MNDRKNPQVKSREFGSLYGGWSTLPYEDTSAFNVYYLQMSPPQNLIELLTPPY